MDETDFTISDKAKTFLTRKLLESKKKIKKLKQKRKMIKALYYSSITLSVTLSTLLSALAGFSMLPVYIIPVLSITSGILTALSAKFNFEGKKIELNKTIEKLNKLQTKLDYVVSCNGDFKDEDFNQLMTEF